MESYIHDTIALPEILDGPVTKSYLTHSRTTAMVKADSRQEDRYNQRQESSMIAAAFRCMCERIADLR